MNPKLFIADSAFLLFFVSEGVETHNSDSSFLESEGSEILEETITLPISVLELSSSSGSSSKSAGNGKGEEQGEALSDSVLRRQTEL